MPYILKIFHWKQWKQSLIDYTCASVDAYYLVTGNKVFVINISLITINIVSYRLYIRSRWCWISCHKKKSIWYKYFTDNYKHCLIDYTSASIDAGYLITGSIVFGTNISLIMINIVTCRLYIRSRWCWLSCHGKYSIWYKYFRDNDENCLL